MVLGAVSGLSRNMEMCMETRMCGTIMHVAPKGPPRRH